MCARRPTWAAVKTVVVKCGSQLVWESWGRLETDYREALARRGMALRERGVRVSIVSSGAIAAGLRELNLAKRPTDLGRLQAVAAVGRLLLAQDNDKLLVVCLFLGSLRYLRQYAIRRYQNHEIYFY